LKTYDVSQILDRIDEGIILLDRHQHILEFNDKAKQITGIKLSGEMMHKSGYIAPGDMVIFISSPLGEDDGGLTFDLLSLLNIDTSDLKYGDTVMGVGLYKTQEIQGVIKRTSKSDISDIIRHAGDFLGNKWDMMLDNQHRLMRIEINGQVFEQHFAKAFGHMVVLDGEKGKLKFYQDKGYTVRSEAIADLLKGNPFLAKNQNQETLELTHRPLQDILVSDQLYLQLERLSLDHPEKLFLEINRRPVYCEVSYFIYQEAYYYLIKFRDLSEMETLFVEYEAILENLEALRATSRLIPIPEALEQFDALIGQSDAIQKVKYMAFQASQIKSNVLITGESGTGKTLLAELIHKHSHQKGPFIEVNCAAIPTSLFESELFGYESGAFTGADHKGKRGLFELAEGGTLFLDEIGELPQDIQVKLLQALQSKQFYKIGASKPTRVNTRIITATNKKLYEAVLNKQFREDLYYRINVFPIHLPPLRERQTDLYLLTKQTVKRIAETMEMPEKRVSSDAFSWLKQHPFPGNIRELENILERAMAMSQDQIIEAHHLKNTYSPYTLEEDKTLKARLSAFERQVILDALNSHKTHANAMQHLGLSRSTFYEKLKKYGLTSSS
jgi:transcriptional regulator with PAS, ATPase and Fis domain